ncbi:hypothetical protein GCM10011611_54610 [Aliidongia dinghuensis]|uniref:Uncharacterized protein n=1 Tax=Aliidongia dinghuensis TaxID=1867774 RepID=A0A8J3E7H7_9PROT|nr:hypothetical protein GCM10011611_54610 [Aliidongia dinghuensis]
MSKGVGVGGVVTKVGAIVLEMGRLQPADDALRQEGGRQRRTAKPGADPSKVSPPQQSGGIERFRSRCTAPFNAP